MPTTFNVFSLGNLADIDTTEGNTLAENAGALVGLTFGGVQNALLNNRQTFSPGSTGFAGGTTNAYDQTNAPAETFRINGGAEQTFDSSVVYNATITYTDGTTATVTAVIFQDTAGNTYWAPEFAANADQVAMQAQPIRSLTLDSLNSATFSGMTGDRQTWNVVTCYLRGTRILTPQGEKPIETLQPGDLVMTRDNGRQPILWIGASTVMGQGRLAPVRIARGALGQGLPLRDLYVSRQHRMLLRSRVAERMFGSPEILVPAIKLIGLPGIAVTEVPTQVTWFHLLTEPHQIIFAEGAPSETLLTGAEAMRAVGAEAAAELALLFPELIAHPVLPARPCIRNARLDRLLQRHRKNGLALVA